MDCRPAYLGLMLVSLAACQTMQPPSPQEGSMSATTAPADGISPELRDLLAGMARSHEQKTLLAFYEGFPIAKTSGAIHAFFGNMTKLQADALKDLRDWAEAHKVNLAYRPGNDLDAKALKIMEARQEKEVRSSNNTDFARTILLQMYQDYEWQVSLIQAVKPEVKDPQLLAYLDKSEQIHQQGSAEIMGLLKKYKYTP
jgi:hypothetical protein